MSKIHSKSRKGKISNDEFQKHLKSQIYRGSLKGGSIILFNDKGTGIDPTQITQKEYDAYFEEFVSTKEVVYKEEPFLILGSRQIEVISSSIETENEKVLHLINKNMEI